MFKTTVRTIADLTGESTCDSIVLSIVRVLETKINDAVTNKQIEINTQIPLDFPELKNFTRKDAQKLIYGRVLQELDIAGYTSEIKMSEAVTMINIKWKSSLSEKLSNEMLNVIKDHLPREDKERIEKAEREKTKSNKSNNFKTNSNNNGITYF
jgi:uncharacterized secreted protein with C-terminal beta-propeller domain